MREGRLRLRKRPSYIYDGGKPSSVARLRARAIIYLVRLAETDERLNRG